jgi:hypothetical protein
MGVDTRVAKADRRSGDSGHMTCGIAPLRSWRDRPKPANQTIMAIAGQVSWKMLEHYRRIRQKSAAESG